VPVLYALLFAMSLLAASSVWLIEAQQRQFYVIHQLYQRQQAQVHANNLAEGALLVNNPVARQVELSGAFE
jgi:hypothetical protein